MLSVTCRQPTGTHSLIRANSGVLSSAFTWTSATYGAGLSTNEVMGSVRAGCAGSGAGGGALSGARSCGAAAGRARRDC